MDPRLEGLPADALAFVQGELQSGNALLSVMRPPAGAMASVYVMLARPVRDPEPPATHKPASPPGDPATDSPAPPGFAGRCFGMLAPGLPAVVVLGAEAMPSDPAPVPALPAEGPSRPPLQRFVQSLAIDHEAWREGMGYDLAAIDEAPPAQRALMLEHLLDTGLQDWRDIQAVARIGGRAARRALRHAWRHGSTAQRMAMLRHAPGTVTEPQRIQALVQALGEARLYAGLSECLDAVEDCHPPVVMQALWSALQRPEAEVTVHCAAMLTHLHGLADTRFDWSQRPFFLRFGSDDPAERAAAQAELRQRIATRGP